MDDLLRELDSHAIDAASLKWRRCFERAAERIRQLEANCGGGDTAIAQLQQENEAWIRDYHDCASERAERGVEILKLKAENEALRKEAERRADDFDFWIKQQFHEVDGKLHICAMSYPHQMNREQADKLVAHLRDVVAALPTLEQRLADACGCCPECGGIGVIDSGGSEPWGQWINVPCSTCSGRKERP